MEMTCQEGNLHNTMNTYLCASVCVCVCVLSAFYIVSSFSSHSLSQLSAASIDVFCCAA